MKKLFPITAIAMFAALSFSSCKKDHTCTCKIHDTWQDTLTNVNGQDSIVADGIDTSFGFSLGKQKTSDAKSACDNYQKEYSQLSDSVNCGI